VTLLHTSIDNVTCSTHSELAKIINGADVLAEDGRRVGEEKNGTLVSSLGFETIDDIYCRKFLISQDVGFAADQKNVKGASGKSRIEITVWENYGARQLHRIEMFGNAWVVQELVSIVNEDMNPLPLEAFNIDYLLAGCDPEGFFPPSMVNPSRVSDIIVPDPAWGVFTETNITQAIEDDSNVTNTNITHAIEDFYNGLRRSSALIVQQEPSALEVELKSDSKAFSKMLVIKYYELHGQYMRRKEGPQASVEGMDDSGCTNGCCFFSTGMLGEEIEEALEKKLGITGGIKFCFKDGIHLGICIIHPHCI